MANQVASTITTTYARQFGSTVYFLAQQKASRLRPYVRVEIQKALAAYYDRIGTVDVVEKQVRHSDTPLLEPDFSRRMVTMRDFEWATLIDKADEIRTLIDPKSAVLKSAMMSFGRNIDKILIQAALGVAQGDSTGTTSVPLPDSQRFVSLSAPSTPDNLNVAALRRARLIITQSDADIDSGLFLAANASALDALLSQTQVTSSDYNSVKALVNGEVDTFMGFKFIRLEAAIPKQATDVAYNTVTGMVNVATTATLTASTANAARCVAFTGDSLLLAVGSDLMSRIDEREDKSYSTQVYASMSLGASRMDENKVVEIICKQS